MFCLVTERANQARDHLLKKDLTGFDGWVLPTLWCKHCGESALWSQGGRCSHVTQTLVFACWQRGVCGRRWHVQWNTPWCDWAHAARGRRLWERSCCHFAAVSTSYRHHPCRSLLLSWSAAAVFLRIWLTCSDLIDVKQVRQTVCATQQGEWSTPLLQLCTLFLVKICFLSNEALCWLLAFFV